MIQLSTQSEDSLKFLNLREKKEKKQGTPKRTRIQSSSAFFKWSNNKKKHQNKITRHQS